MVWLSNWYRRKQLYVNGTSAGNQSPYQMRITVNYGTGTDSAGNIYCNTYCKSDFSDIRFTDTDGTTLLYYWIESYTTSSNAKIWIKIPNIPTGSNSAYIYVYYSNPGATSASNGTNTFEFFDGFDTSGNYTVTSSASGQGKMIITNSYGYNSPPNAAYVGGDPYSGGPTTFWTKARKTLSILTSSYRVEFYGKTSHALGGSYIDYGYTQINDVTQHTFYDNINWTLYAFNFTGAINSITLYQQMYLFNGGYGAIWDDIRIRKYASPEPLWSPTITTEQGAVLNITSNPTGAEVWLRTPSGTGSYIDQGVTTNTTINVTPGTYDMELILSGGQTWYLLNQTFTAGNTYNIQATFTGQLFISSTPIGAEVWLSGYDWGVQTNTTITGLNPSPPDYNITLKLTNYQDWIGSATVYSTLTTSVIATFAGSASISSTPPGAAVYLDGSPTPSGNTPLIIKNLTPATSDGSAPTQSHTYILRFTGYADTSGSFTATAGQTINVTITFPGSIYISSLPEGAQIFIDGILQ